jgi:deoxyribodipyrimidine photolyase-related protein
MNLIIILTNQLYEKSPILDKIDKDTIIFLYEHPIYFTEYKYHKMKLVMHRATMKFYYDYLEKKIKNKIKYLEFNDDLVKEIKKMKAKNLIVYNPTDHTIMKEYLNICKTNDLTLELFDNPGNICTVEDYNDYLKESKNKNPYFHHSFYIWCRKKYGILVDKNENPIGNKWSFDAENRIPFPKDYDEDIEFKIKKNEYTTEAKKYVNKHFHDNHGNDDYYLAIDFKGAKAQLDKFLKERLDDFGPYEDAVKSNIIFGTHSVLSPLINIGLITPNYILEKVQEYYKTKKPKIQSVEGYIRQLFWREFCVLVYLNKNKELEKGNLFNHNEKLDKSWYDGTTPITLINDLVKKALEYGWVHHIERLMYLGNFMFLTQIHPKYVYKWFMEMFIDAYPWVMSPNVYGMSQHSAGPIMMKRPYFSSSNYIDKMSNYKKKEGVYEKIKLNNNNNEYEWYEIWDALYYNFINNNIKDLSKNYSTANIVAIWKKQSDTRKKELLNIAKSFLKY